MNICVEEDAEEIRYFRDDFHKRYGMGAVRMVAGSEDEGMKDKVEECMMRLTK